MSYSDELLRRIRELNAELERYGDATDAAGSAKRDEILEALAWYVHKLQMRVLPRPSIASVSPAAEDFWPQQAARANALPVRAAAR